MVRHLPLGRPLAGNGACASAPSKLLVPPPRPWAMGSSSHRAPSDSARSVERTAQVAVPTSNCNPRPPAPRAFSIPGGAAPCASRLAEPCDAMPVEVAGSCARGRTRTAADACRAVETQRDSDASPWGMTAGTAQSAVGSASLGPVRPTGFTLLAAPGRTDPPSRRNRKCLSPIANNRRLFCRCELGEGLPGCHRPSQARVWRKPPVAGRAPKMR